MLLPFPRFARFLPSWEAFVATTGERLKNQVEKVEDIWCTSVGGGGRMVPTFGSRRAYGAPQCPPRPVHRDFAAPPMVGRWVDGPPPLASHVLRQG
eukprot:5124125-Pyramimonas_sp.AAC.1